jgi:hypothetical protein
MPENIGYRGESIFQHISLLSIEAQIVSFILPGDSCRLKWGIIFCPIWKKKHISAHLSFEL